MDRTKLLQALGRVLNPLLRWVILGPLVWILYPVSIIGRESLPKQGPCVIILGPHTTEIESAAIVARLWWCKVRFLAKAAYWRKNWLTYLFMEATGSLPVNRDNPRKANEDINVVARALAHGNRAAIYPEGTRNREDHPVVVRQGRPGIIRMILRAEALLGHPIPIVLGGMQGFDALSLPGHGYRWRRSTLVLSGPVFLDDFKSDDEELLTPEQLESQAKVTRRIIKDMMQEVARLAETDYRDELLPISD